MQLDTSAHARAPNAWDGAGAVALVAALLWLLWVGVTGSHAIQVWIIAMLAPVPVLLYCRAHAPPPTLAQVLMWALALRVAALWAPAYFEDDYFRYLWDGFRSLTDMAPFRHAPSYYFADPTVPPRLADALSGLNNPDIATIYGPALQWLFALAAWIAPGELLPLRALWITADLALVWALARHVDLRHAMLYALCPLVVHEIAVAAHPDGLLGALLLASALVAIRGRFLWAGLFLGTACAMKIHVLLALPFLLIATPTLKPRAVIGFLAMCALSYGLFWLPFLFTPGQFSAALAVLATFARDWQFNALGFWLIESTIGGGSARVVAAVLMAALWLCVWWWLWRAPLSRRARLGAALTLAFSILLFFSPVINAWYVLWLLPLACATRWVSPWAAAFILPISYLTKFNLGQSHTPYSLPVWVSVVELLVILLAVAWDIFTARRQQHYPFPSLIMARPTRAPPPAR